MKLLSKRSGIITALGVGLGLAASAAIAYAAPTFGPARPTFTWAHPAKYITFDSITDNPNWPGGDERYFVKARDLNASPSTYTNQMQVTDGEELVVVSYFHNNADTILNLHAKNTKLGVNLPSGAATDQSIKSTISADNANPTQVWSTMDLTMGGSDFTVDYVPGSATIHTAYFDSALSDNVVNGGVQIGSKALDGDVPGCFQFSGYVYIHVKVHKKVTPPTPVYSCDLLNVTVGDNRKVTGSVNYTAKNGASLSNVNWVWGDNSQDNTGTVTTKDHTYATNGDKTITVNLTFNVNGDQKTVTSENCSKTVNVNIPTPPPSTPPQTPPQLPNTGAGSVVGIFAGVSALATAAHYILSGRRVRQ